MWSGVSLEDKYRYLFSFHLRMHMVLVLDSNNMQCPTDQFAGNTGLHPGKQESNAVRAIKLFICRYIYYLFLYALLS